MFKAGERVLANAFHRSQTLPEGGAGPVVQFPKLGVEILSCLLELAAQRDVHRDPPESSGQTESR
jgi:hypothetical protein